VFIYRDSKDRPIATFKKPLAKVYDVAYLKVVQQGEFGAFIDFGLDRDIFVPLKEQRFKLRTGDKGDSRKPRPLDRKNCRKPHGGTH
jgi:predicted RNA-binding protein (virulence factor B family)